MISPLLQLYKVLSDSWWTLKIFLMIFLDISSFFWNKNGKIIRPIIIAGGHAEKGGWPGGGLSKVGSDTWLTLKNIFEVTKTFGNDILIKWWYKPQSKQYWHHIYIMALWFSVILVVGKHARSIGGLNIA